MYLNTIILEGLQIQLQILSNTLKSISNTFSYIFQILFILYYYVGKRKATHIETSSL